MLGVPRYLIPGDKDTLTGYITLHPGAWDKVERVVNRAVKKGKRSVKVNLTNVGSPVGDDMAVFTYNVIGDKNEGFESFNGEIPCNSISFNLTRKGKIAKYTFDAVDDRFDCSNDLKTGFTRGLKSRPMSTQEIFKQNQIAKTSGLGDAFFYFDNVLWAIQQYGNITGGSEIVA